MHINKTSPRQPGSYTTESISITGIGGSNRDDYLIPSILVTEGDEEDAEPLSEEELAYLEELALAYPDEYEQDEGDELIFSLCARRRCRRAEASMSDEEFEAYRKALSKGGAVYAEDVYEQESLTFNKTLWSGLAKLDGKLVEQSETEGLVHAYCAMRHAEDMASIEQLLALAFVPTGDWVSANGDTLENMSHAKALLAGTVLYRFELSPLVARMAGVMPRCAEPTPALWGKDTILDTVVNLAADAVWGFSEDAFDVRVTSLEDRNSSAAEETGPSDERAVLLELNPAIKDAGFSSPSPASYAACECVL